MSGGEVRFRRPAHHEVLIKKMQDEAGFPYIRDVLLFAAGVGVHEKRRVPFEKSGEPIRYDTLTEPRFAGVFVALIAAGVSSGDPEILDGSRIQDRVGIFEEYANGGLECIQEAVNVRKEQLEVVLRSLVTDAVTTRGVARPASIEDLLQGVDALS